MKTLKITSMLLLLICFIACKKDIRELRSDLSKQKELIAQLQSAMNTINTDVKSLQAITTAIQNKVSVVSYVPTATGYTLAMSNGTTIDLKNGTNGADAPNIGVKIDADGQYYWTLANEFLLQNGQKLRVTGNSGITPLLRVDATTNYWMASYNNGSDWVVVKDNNGNPIVAVGAAGPGGVAGFGITETTDTIFITYNGSTYTLPKGNSTGGTTVPYMIFATSKSANATISLQISADLADRAGVWIDLNNDKKQDPGEKIGVFGFLSPFILNGSQTFTIYGKVSAIHLGGQQIVEVDLSGNTALTSLEISNNELRSLDVSKNTALVTLGCTQNNINSVEMEKLINSLPTRTTNGEAYIVSAAAGEMNATPTSASISAANAKKWKLYKSLFGELVP